MAIQARSPIEQRPVRFLLQEGLVQHVAVAAAAQLEPRLLHHESILRRGFHVALVAHLVEDGRMHVRPEDAPRFRAMGIVTGRTPGLSHGIVHVLGGEGGLIGTVTVRAQGGLALGQQEIRLRPGVRIVARDAALGHGAVLERVRADGRGHVLVAAEADIVSRKDQIVLVLRRVRIVAAHAVAAGDRLVNALRPGRDDTGVALQADRARLRGEELAVRGSVRIVTVRAVSLFDRSMDEGELQNVLEVRMAAHAVGPLGAGLEVKGIRVRSGEGRRRDQRRRQSQSCRQEERGDGADR